MVDYTPIERIWLPLNKQEFWDALALRYNWQLNAVPVTCVGGKSFTPDHAMICSHGGYPTIRRNELRDLYVALLTEVCHNVAIEPTLLPLDGETVTTLSTNTSPDAPADFRAIGFWTRGEEAYFDVLVFHPYASSYLSRALTDLFKLHEQLKRLEYQERIVNIDRGSFAPLVFSTTGSDGQIAERFLQHLAAKLAENDSTSYSSVMAWLRCRTSFAL